MVAIFPEYGHVFSKMFIAEKNQSERGHFIDTATRIKEGNE
jgi:hypothetical protein